MTRRSITRTVAAASIASVLLAIAVPRTALAVALKIDRSTLKSGAVLLVSEQHNLPMVTVAIAFDAGTRRDPSAKAGLATLAASSLMQGTKQLSATEFNQKVDFMGGSVNVSAGRDYATAGFTSLKRYQNETLKLLAAVLTQPGLREADIQRKRAELLAAIKANEEQPGYVAGVTFDRKLFDDGPYGNPALGTTESVGTLTPDDVRKFYGDHYRLGSAIIAVAGDVTAAEIAPLLDAELAGLAGTVPPQAAPSNPDVPRGINADVIDRDVTQANIALGFVGIARSNPDYYRVSVMNHILGAGGFGSRLMDVVRSKAGLAYSIGSSFEAGLFPGAFQVSLQTKNQSANDAIRMILQQLREIQEKPVEDVELDRAQKYMIGSFPLRIDRQGAIASFMLQIEYYGLGLDYAEKYPGYISAVSKQDVLDVARRYLHSDSVIVVAVADQQEAKIDTSRLGAR
ncbi:MAG: M16 family metallopeptidase [Candidatus Binataceae bacterium]